MLTLKFYLIVFCSTFVVSQDSTCGSLITFRQHAVLLNDSPPCFRNGCGDETPASNMASACPTSSRCNSLWNHLREQYQQNWCSSSSCSGDPACRIPGWPVLNITAACELTPHEWLFGALGGCCVRGNEPFLMGDWTSSLCNSSQWRAPFAFFGGMAREDREEWILPLNWTVQVHNTSQQNFTATSCAPPSNIYALWVLDNFLHAAFAILLGVIYVGLALWRTRVSTNLKWWKAITAGLGDGAALLIGNLVAAITLRNTPGYQDIPIGELFVLLNARPSLMAFILAFGLFLIPLEDDINRGRRHARQMLAKLSAGFALAEIVTQAAGAKYLGQTANVGRIRGFYNKDALLPYHLGASATRMYAGGLLWTIFAPFFFIFLFVYMVQFIQKLAYEEYEILRKLYDKDPFVEELKKVADELMEQREQSNGRMIRREARARQVEDRNRRSSNRNQRKEERSIRARDRATRESLREERRAERATSRDDQNPGVEVSPDREAANRQEEQADQEARDRDSQEERRDTDEERQDQEEEMTDQRHERQDMLEEAKDARAEAEAEAKANRSMGGSRSHRFRGRFYRFMLNLGIIEYYNKLAYRHLIQKEAARNPALREALQKLENIRPRDVEPMTNEEIERWAVVILRPPTDEQKSARHTVVGLVLFFASISYIAQWLFWSGFVETMGPRLAIL